MRSGNRYSSRKIHDGTCPLRIIICCAEKHCSMAAIPSLEEEDAKRPHREREQLVNKRTSSINRMHTGAVGHPRVQSKIAQRTSAACDPMHAGRVSYPTQHYGRTPT